VALSYASAVLLPAGRAAGEAVRAATLAPSIGLGRATSACSRLQACVLVGNTALSFAAGGVVLASGASRLLGLALLANGVLCGFLTIALLWIVRNERVAAWLKARFKRFAQPAPSAPLKNDAAAVTNAALFCCAGRGVEALQYVVVLHAVGAIATPARAVTAQGIRLVGATVGDFLPNQMGATEGAYRLFADALGLGATPARALSIALVVRIAQLALSGIAFLVAMAALRQPRSAEAP
jgi:hypothetical protein